jgi:hypothetical protein
MRKPQGGREASVAPVVQVVLSKCDQKFKCVGVPRYVGKTADTLARESFEFGGKRDKCFGGFVSRIHELHGGDGGDVDQMDSFVLGDEGDCIRRVANDLPDESIQPDGQSNLMSVTQEIVEVAGLKLSDRLMAATNRFQCGCLGGDLLECVDELGGDVVRRSGTGFSTCPESRFVGVHLIAIATFVDSLNQGLEEVEQDATGNLSASRDAHSYQHEDQRRAEPRQSARLVDSGGPVMRTRPSC